ncbi:MAG TPA: type II toxin-antitoxin system RelE/ParE family toxin [Thermoanaerobaculia bacterium]
MNFSSKIKARAAKSLSRIPKAERSRLIQAIDRLRREPLAGGTPRGEFSGLRRLRVGDYRIVYEVLHEQVTVLVVRIGHRREVYH